LHAAPSLSQCSDETPSLSDASLLWISVMKRALSLFLFAACLLASCLGADKTSAVPVLVELFTSEGCSSCPPADAWLLQLDTAQPVTGAQLIVLSEHVDYWNHDGWKDPYSSALVTQRQSDYAHAFRLDTSYTPQVVVNGTVNLKLSDSEQIRQTFQQAVSTPMVPITIGSAAVEPGDPAILRAQVEVDGSSAQRSADIYEAVLLSHAESQVLHGENGGKHLTHVAVVEQLTKIGKLEKGKNFTRAIAIKLKPGMDPKNIRLVVFAQEPGPGKVLGAALQESLQ
jgi:hypothetical protein